MDIVHSLLGFDTDQSRAAVQIGLTHPILREFLQIGANLPEAKGIVPALAFWFLWFRPAPDVRVRRITLVSVLGVAVVAIVVGRMLANVLPFRYRPIGTVEVMGSAVRSTEFVDRMSSLPSDHAVLFFALAAGFFLVSRWFGALVFAHAFLVISL